MHSIDLNSDLAEGYGAYRLTEDEALLDLVSSANVACGLHAGDPEIMAHTFRLAKIRGSLSALILAFLISGASAAAVFRSQPARSSA